MKRRPFLIILCLVSAAVAAAGCALVGTAEPPPTETLPPAPTFQLPPTATLSPPTPTPQPVSPACIPDLQPVEFAFGSYPDAPEAVLAYLNAGGSPVALADLLNQAGFAAQPVTVAVADFTGDGRHDVAAAFANPDSGNPSFDGRLVVYVCHLAGYEVGLNLRAGDEYFRGFYLWYWQDLDAAGGDELVVSQGLCGAHTCFEDLRVLGWDGAGFVDRLEGSTADLPFPDVRVSDPDGDGVFQIEVASGGFGSVGAGPQRPVTWIWRLAQPGKIWRPSEERADPSPYRIHVLHDADDASISGAYEVARQLYRRVIDDQTLDDWIVENGYENLAAYARYRLAVIAVALQETDAAAAWISEMESLYPPGSPYQDYVAMAVLFRNAFSGGGLETACTGAAGYAEANAETVLEPLGSQVYGYANRDYSGEDMCPAP